MFEEMNREAAGALDAALRSLGAEYGVDVALGNGTYNPDVGTFEVRVKFALPGADERRFRQYASYFGLQPDDFGAEFEYEGRGYRITGLNPRARRFPVEVEREDLARFKFTTELVNERLGRTSKRYAAGELA